MKFKYRDYVTVNHEFFPDQTAGVVVNWKGPGSLYDPAVTMFLVHFNDGNEFWFDENQLVPQAKPWSVPNSIQVHSPNGTIFGPGAGSIDASITTNGPLVDGPNFKITYT